MLVSAILSATISHHSFFKVQVLCTNETNDSIENIDKVNIVSTIQFQNANFVSCITV